MGEQVCMTGAECCDGAAGVDANGYPVETTGNAVLDILEHRSSTRAFARDDDDRPVAVTDERDGGSEHAETPHKLKTYESGGLPDCYLNMHCICGLRTTTSHINAHVRRCGAM